MSVLVFHGTMGSPEGNWFPWLKAQLPDVVVPRLPTPEGQDPRNWLAAIPAIGPDDILIGHSCGATFLLHVLEGLAAPVRQSVFVSPVMGVLGLPEYDRLNRAFFDYPFDWTKIRANMERSAIFHGDNDPYVPMMQAFELHNALGGHIEIIPGGGHLNGESGFSAFPRLLEWVVGAAA
ncbi:MAG: alpha/beta hydrolase [Alphaproteobacteria bacterium]|nr:alpha/beta hydrolase [Alphaproteobacteria bacterium]USO07766.1 MAG: alpha/beta hydrolase [Rhodospirillales bacterium]